MLVVANYNHAGFIVVGEVVEFEAVVPDAGVLYDGARFHCPEEVPWARSLIPFRAIVHH